MERHTVRPNAAGGRRRARGASLGPRPAPRSSTGSSPAQRGSEAIEIFQRRPAEISVIMSDQRMPGMTGVEVLHQARQIRPRPPACCSRPTPISAPSSTRSTRGASSATSPSPGSPTSCEAVVRQAVEQHDLIVEKHAAADRAQDSRTRKLVEANRLKWAFIEVASHELNTPVTVVLGLTELWKASLSETAPPVRSGMGRADPARRAGGWPRRSSGCSSSFEPTSSARRST